MHRLLWIAALSFNLVTFAVPAVAQSQDPAAARELLKQGYELKTQQKYADALPHLLESYRLDPQLKTLLNLADCEEQLGKLVDAQKHWVLARDKASAEGDEQFHQEAERRLSALEARMPRLTIALASGAPAHTEVLRDGVLLGAVSLGVALPLDPGEHVILARAAGHPEKSFKVTLAESDRIKLEVFPEQPASKNNHSDVGVLGIGTHGAQGGELKPMVGGSTGKSQRIIGLGLAGLGAVSFGVAGVSWLNANNKHEEALDKNKKGDVKTANALNGEAGDAATLTTIALVAGGVLVTGGAVLWFTAPKAETKSATVKVRYTPVLSPNYGGLAVHGLF